MSTKSTQDKIVELLKERSCLKQDVFQHTSAIFEELKTILFQLESELKERVSKLDARVEVEFRSRGVYEAELKFGGDVLLFQMHTNVFNFDKTHGMWRTSYVKENGLRAYCGMINIYNFLSDSIKYNRSNDSGYLVARLFVNNDNHFFVEGKRQLGFLYNDFVNGILDTPKLKDIIESAILYAIDFDLLTPPYDEVKEITVFDAQELSNNMKIKTGKRLGFKFEADESDTE